MSSLATGALLGLVFGLGLAGLVAALTTSTRPSLESRVLPYVRDVTSATSAWRPRAPSDRAAAAVVALGQPLVLAAAARLGRVLGGHPAVQRRLDRAGSAMTVEGFRLSQLAWGSAFFGAALVVGLLGPARQPGGAASWLLVSSGAFLAGVTARDGALTRAIKRREAEILTTFPVVADLLALAVAAGEGPVGGLARVVSTTRGALSDDLAAVLAEARTGVPISSALDALAARSGLSIVSRFAEGLAVAIERGTPLVDVLAAQAADVREARRRALIESGARKEIAMMVPVVFLIMPVTLLFTFFPGVVGLKLLAA